MKIYHLFALILFFTSVAIAEDTGAALKENVAPPKELLQTADAFVQDFVKNEFPKKPSYLDSKASDNKALLAYVKHIRGNVRSVEKGEYVFTEGKVVPSMVKVNGNTAKVPAELRYKIVGMKRRSYITFEILSFKKGSNGSWWLQTAVEDKKK